MADEENIDQTLNDTATEIASREGGAAEDTTAGGAGVDTGTTSPIEYPKSWGKDFEQTWTTYDRKLQEQIVKREKDFHEGIGRYSAEAQYAKSFRDVFVPYQALLDAQGIKDHAQAARFLLNAHYQLSSGQPNERLQYFARLANTYGLKLEDLAKIAAQPGAVAAATADPAFAALTARFDKLEGAYTAETRARYEALQASTRTEVEAFASDPANILFNEVADDVAALLGAYPKMSLKDAYDRAVWGNPVTRVKEQQRVVAAAEAERKAKAQEQHRAANAARGTVLRGKDSQRPPEEPKGTMEDTLRDTLKEIHNRT